MVIVEEVMRGGRAGSCFTCDVNRISRDQMYVQAFMRPCNSPNSALSTFLSWQLSLCTARLLLQLTSRIARRQL